MINFRNRILIPSLRALLDTLPYELRGQVIQTHQRGGKVSFKWNIRCLDSDGGLKWEELLVRNLLHDEGEEAILGAAYTEGYTVPAAYYIGLDDRASIAEGDSLTDLVGEPAVGGYARQAVNSDATDWTLEQDAGDWQVVSKTVTFTPSGASYPAVLNMFLCDVATGTSGKLHASVALSQERTVLDGDSLQTDITIKLSE